MIRVWVADEAMPFSAETLAHADDAGANQVRSLADPATARLGLVEVGYHEIAEPGDTLAERVAAKLAALADRRWTASLASTWRGRAIACDVTAATNVLGAVVGLQLANSTGPVMWKFDEGFLDMTLADLIDLGQAMRAHVQACFVNEADLTRQIAAAVDAGAVAKIDITHGWPT